MGAVYLAEHELMGKQAAVKVLLPQHCAVPEVVTRFFNEAKSASMIKHPGIVDIYDFGKQDDGSAFIVMELLEGEELSELLQREGRLPSHRVALLGQQMAKALEAAHKLGIVHRDLKPDNVFLEPDEAAKGGVRPKILDFGIAKLGGDLTGSSIKTRTGAIMGTPVFMSPEQCTGAGGVDHRSDIYSLGCILYMMVCGRPPFVLEGVGALIAAHIGAQPESPRVYEPGVDEELERIIMATLEKFPNDRPQTMDELADALAGVAIGSVAGPSRPRASTADLYGEETPVTDPKLAKTTLSTSAGPARTIPAEEGRESSNKGLFIGAALVLAIGGGVGAFAMSGGDDEPTQSAESQVAASSSNASPTPAKTDAEPAAEVISPQPEEPDIKPSTPKKIEITIDSEPRGARVYNRITGVKLGTTPFVDSFPAGKGELEFRLMHDGFEAKVVAIPLQEDVQKNVTLTAVEDASNVEKKPKDKKGRRKEPKAEKPDEPTSDSKPKEDPPPKKDPPKESKWGELAP